MKLKSIDSITVLAVVIASLTSPLSVAAPSRISSQLVNIGEVHKIYLARGLVSVVQLPYPVTEVKVGSPEDVQVQVSKTLPSELTLVLKRAGAQGTNLVARCGSRTFVFDLVPSHKTHQDLVRISGSYGAPEMAEMGAVLIDSSRPVNNVGAKNAANTDMALVDSSSKSLIPNDGERLVAKEVQQ